MRPPAAFAPLAPSYFDPAVAPLNPTVTCTIHGVSVPHLSCLLVGEAAVRRPAWGRVSATGGSDRWGDGTRRRWLGSRRTVYARERTGLFALLRTAALDGCHRHPRCGCQLFPGRRDPWCRSSNPSPVTLYHGQSEHHDFPVSTYFPPHSLD
jgi:hypothetical protein